MRFSPVAAAQEPLAAASGRCLEMVALLRCGNCMQLTLSATFCAYCSVRIAGVDRHPSVHGKARLINVRARLEELHALEADSAVTASRLHASFIRFLAEQGVNDPQLADALPADVVGFLVARDETGRTTVHSLRCPLWGLSKAETGGRCSCPVRAAASAVKAAHGTLQGIFRDAGLVSEWSPQDGTGNPCAAAPPRRLIKLLQKEQLQAGIKALQAGLFDVSVYELLMVRVLGLWTSHRAAGRHLLALSAAREALYYAILWHTGLRASEALRLLRQHIEHIRAVGAMGLVDAWDLHVGVSKTASGTGDARVLRLLDDGTSFSPMRAFDVFVDAAAQLGLSVADGQVFREVHLRDLDDAPTWGRECQWKDLSLSFKAHLAAMGLSASKSVSLHSFHGSRGARERALGIEASLTCNDMDWSYEMYCRYTDGRVPFSVDDLLVVQVRKRARPVV